MDVVKRTITSLIESTTQQFEYQPINKVLTDMFGQLLNEKLQAMKDASVISDYKITMELSDTPKGKILQGGVFYNTTPGQKFKIITFLVE